MITNTLLHNRLNLKYLPNDNITADIEIRNRLFYGNLLILIPNLTYSIADNWDIDLIGQIFFADDNQNKFGNVGELVYLRLKWRF